MRLLLYSATAPPLLAKLLAVVLVPLVEDSTVASAADTRATPVLRPATSAEVPTTLPVTARLRL